MELVSIGRDRMRREAQVLADAASRLDVSFEQAAQAMAECRGHVIVSGVGTTGMVGRRLAHLLCCVGCPALFLHSGDSLHGSSAAVTGQDVLFLISRSGETEESCALAEIASESRPTIIALTARPGSRLGRVSTITLKLDTPDDIDPYDGLMSVGSSLAMAGYCDALVWAVLEVKGTPKERFVRSHPGGVISRM